MDNELTDLDATGGGAQAHVRAIAPAGPAEMAEALALVQALLAELGDEGQEFAQIDRVKLERDLDEASRSGRFLALLAREPSGAAIGVLTLSTGFAVYAGGEYGVIDEMYVAPEWRGRGVGAGLVEAAVRVARERRWFRLDVTGPNSARDAGGADTARDSGARRLGGAEAAHEPDAHRAGGATLESDGALRFYLRVGFEPTGQKLRLLV